MTVTKAEWRKYLRSLHAGTAERDRQSALLCSHILTSGLFADAKVVSGYMPLAREVDVTPVLNAALAQGKVLALPRCDQPPHMTLRRVAALAELTPGPYGLLEPPADAPILAPGDVDLLLVPLEGIDERGMRLGKGGGYYDCLLNGKCGVTLGCALTWQKTKRLPADVWDKPLDALADQDGIHYLPQRHVL